MKIKKKLKFLSIFLMLTLMSFSCTSDYEQGLASQEDRSAMSFYDKESIENAELNEQLAYKNFHLTKLMEEVISSIPDFDGQLTSKSSKGEHIGAEHFRVLLSKSQKGNKEASTDDNIQFSLEAFLGLDGDSWYPYVKKIKEGKGSDPLFLINSFESKKGREVVEGYKLNVKGELNLEFKDVSREDIFGSGTSKAIAGGDVYALALSTCDGKIAKCASGGDGGDGGDGDTGGTTLPDAVFGYMKIKDKKESWLERADVNKQSYFSDGPVSGNIYGPCGNGCDTKGDEIGKWRNGDIGTTRTVNHTFFKYYNTSLKGNVVAYVIYEYDNWPATLHQYNSYVNGANFKFRYRSYQSPYDENTITLNSADPYGVGYSFPETIDNSEIQYNTTRK